MFVLDERAQVKKDYEGSYWKTWDTENGCRLEIEPVKIYEIETRYGCSTREITLYYFQTRMVWEGDVIEFGENRKLDSNEIEQCKTFLMEMGSM